MHNSPYAMQLGDSFLDLKYTYKILSVLFLVHLIFSNHPFQLHIIKWKPSFDQKILADNLMVSEAIMISLLM